MPLKFTSRSRLLPSLALVLCLLGGAAEPFYSSFQDHSDLSSDRDSVVAPRPVTAISLGRPAKLRSGVSFRKNRPQAVRARKSPAATLPASSLRFVSCHVRHLTADVALGFGRSPPALSL